MKCLSLWHTCQLSSSKHLHLCSSHLLCHCLLARSFSSFGSTVMAAFWGKHLLTPLPNCLISSIIIIIIHQYSIMEEGGYRQMRGLFSAFGLCSLSVAIPPSQQHLFTTLFIALSVPTHPPLLLPFSRMLFIWPVVISSLCRPSGRLAVWWLLAFAAFLSFLSSLWFAAFYKTQLCCPLPCSSSFSHSMTSQMSSCLIVNRQWGLFYLPFCTYSFLCPTALWQCP